VSLTTPESIRSLQRKLYTAAKAEPARRFHQLYDKMYREDILLHAYALVRAAKGARTPGVDGETFAAIEGQGTMRWLAGLLKELRNKTYRPQPVRRVRIPKKGGGQRPLGIPTIRDRVAQTAAKLVVEPIFEADFVACAYGYRPKRSAQGAVQSVHQAIRAGYTDVVDGDLSKYFDTIPHHELLQCVARRVVDPHMLKLIKMWLTVAVVEEDAHGKQRVSGGKDSTRGTPQGGVISPLLANIYMHRYLRAWGERGKGQQFRAKLVNYADDFVILSRGHAQEALEWTRWAMGKIGVTLNEEKTCLRNARRESFNFLGYTFGPMISSKTGRPYLGAAPSRKAIQGLREQVRAILHRSNTAPRDEVVRQLNHTLKGWQNYFDYGSLSRAYEAVNWSVLELMRFFLRRRHKVQTRNMWRRFPARWIYDELGVFKLRRRKMAPTPCAAR
jgi:RNA-directed DNA polymerase